MNIRQGRAASSVMWRWLWTIAFACATIPGASWAVSQEPAKDSTSAKTKSPDAVIDRTYEVGELLSRLKSELPTIENPRDEFIRQLSIRAELDVTPTDPWGKPTPSFLDGGDLKWLDESNFKLLEKPDVHDRIAQVISQMNKFGFKKVNLRITMARCSAETWQNLHIQLDEVRPNSGGDWPALKADNASFSIGVL